MNASTSEVQNALTGAEYPANRAELIGHAEEHGASDEVLGDLELLSDDEYESSDEVVADLASSEDDDPELDEVVDELYE